MNITPIKCKNNDMCMQYLLYENKQMCSNIYKRILNQITDLLFVFFLV